MKEIIKQGKSTSKIISAFMNANNMKLEDFKFEVVEEGSKGFFGLFGSKQTKIKFMIPDATDKIREYTEGILRKMDFQFGSVKIKKIDDLYRIEIIQPENAGFLIGKDGKMLDSLQELLNQMINKYEKRKMNIQLDVDNYRKRQNNALVEKVKSISHKVKNRGKSITLEPLEASKRRIVHKFVEKEKNVKTMTVGNGNKKRVVILPSDQKKRSNKKKK